MRHVLALAIHFMLLTGDHGHHAHAHDEYHTEKTRRVVATRLA